MRRANGIAVLAVAGAIFGLSLSAQTPAGSTQSAASAATSVQPAATTAQPAASAPAVESVPPPDQAQNPLSPCRAPGVEPQPMDEKIPCGPQSGQGAARTVARKTWTVPAGTKVLLETRSSVNTKSARPGDGVYLSTVFPVVAGNRVAIPAGVYVQGVVDRVERAGRVKGRAQLDLHFTTLIFPNGTLVDIPGVVGGLPGSEHQKVKDNGEGTVEASGGKRKNTGKVAEIGIPTGGTVGSIAGAAAGHPLAGGLGGLGAGLAAAGIASLFTRGADVNIAKGTQVEMVLQRPLVLQEENLARVAPGSPALVPVADQPQSITHRNRARVLCPPGGLGCDQGTGSE